MDARAAGRPDRPTGRTHKAQAARAAAYKRKEGKESQRENMETRSRPIALNIIKTDYADDDMERSDFVELDLGKEGSYGSESGIVLEDDFAGETKFHYKDFGSIDWYRELAVDQRKRAREKEKAENSPNIVNYVRSLADAASGWIIGKLIFSGKTPSSFSNILKSV